MSLSSVGGSFSVLNGAGPDTLISGAMIGIDVQGTAAGSSFSFGNTEVTGAATINLAEALHQLAGAPTLLVDLDVAYGGIGGYLGVASEHGIALYLSCDNLRKGAALNAIQIAELMLAGAAERAAA